MNQLDFAGKYDKYGREIDQRENEMEKFYQLEKKEEESAVKVIQVKS